MLPGLSLSCYFKLGEDFPEAQGDMEVKEGTVGGCGGPGGLRASQAVSLREESQEGPFGKLRVVAVCLARLLPCSSLSPTKEADYIKRDSS